MSEQNKKQAIIDSLDQVDKAELPLFIKYLKQKTLLRVMFGLMSKETGDLLLATCDEYLKEQEEKKRKAEQESERQAKEYHKSIVDISKLKHTDFMGVSE